MDHQEVSLSGLYSWAGVNGSTPDTIKQGLKLLTSLALTAESRKDIDKKSLRALNQQMARLLMLLSQTSA